MSHEIEGEIFNMVKTIMEIAHKVDRKAKEAKSLEIQNSLKDLLKSFQEELSKGINDKTELLKTLTEQKNAVEKLDTIASAEVENKKGIAESKVLDRNAVLKEARTEMVRGGFSPEAIEKTQKAINKTFDELTKALNVKDVLKEARKDLHAQGISETLIAQTETAIGKVFDFDISKDDPLNKSLNAPSKADSKEAVRTSFDLPGFDSDKAKLLDEAFKKSIITPFENLKNTGLDAGEKLNIRNKISAAFYNFDKALLDQARNEAVLLSEKNLKKLDFQDSSIQSAKKDITRFFDSAEKSLLGNRNQVEALKYPEINMVVGIHKETGWESKLAQVLSKDEANNLRDLSEQLKNQGAKYFADYDRFTVESFVDTDDMFEGEYKISFLEDALNNKNIVTQSKELQPGQDKKIELQSKQLTKSEFMELFSEELKSMQVDTNTRDKINDVMDKVTSKVLSPDYGKPVEWSVAKKANRNEPLEQFRDYINSRKDLSGKGSRLDSVIKEAKEKTVERQTRTLEQRRSQERYKDKMPAHSRGK